MVDFCIEKKEKWKPQEKRTNFHFTIQSIEKQNITRTTKRSKEKEFNGSTHKQIERKELWKKETKGNLDPYRATMRSLRSFSNSSKKRETTSLTKLGVLSSCSCWSCLNWSSRIPFSHPKKKKRERERERERESPKINIKIN